MRAPIFRYNEGYGSRAGLPALWRNDEVFPELIIRFDHVAMTATPPVADSHVIFYNVRTQLDENTLVRSFLEFVRQRVQP